MSDFAQIAKNLAESNKTEVRKLVQLSLDQGVSAKEILDEGLMKGMSIVGEKMEREEIMIPEVLDVAQFMGHIIDEMLKPLLVEGDTNPYGKVVFATVKGDVHDIGKNLVIMMLEGAGFRVIDLGIDVAPETIVEAVRENKPNMLALSALLTTTMPMITTTIDAVKDSGLRDQVKIIIGGAPVDQEFADEVGADGYAPDASSATHLARSLSN
ncbi:MAG: cobalamin-dependent protein [Desulfobacterales bacterium]|jgi:5-methyltetrahydrofolate--homocysteine methyltransferase